MRQLVCSACGSNELIENGRYYVCQYCGTKFERETPRAASFDKTKRLNDLLKRADLYYRNGRKTQAISLYRQALELDARCEIAKQRINGR